MYNVLQLMRAVVMKQKSVLALWHWSQSLQRKVCMHKQIHCICMHNYAYTLQALVCWLMRVMNRKRKAERYAQAMNRYRSRLLHIGVTQWIEVYTDVDLHTLCVLVYVKFPCPYLCLVCNQHASSESRICTAAPNTGTSTTKI